MLLVATGRRSQLTSDDRSCDSHAGRCTRGGVVCCRGIAVVDVFEVVAIVNYNVWIQVCRFRGKRSRNCVELVALQV
jgi:hypothetical protein